MTDTERMRLLMPPYDAEIHKIQMGMWDRTFWLMLAVLAALLAWA